MGKKKNTPVKEDIAEEVCFVCKDGGDLRVCDFKNCLKSYHPLCLGHGQSFMETDEPWVCGWHSCFICNKGSEFRCHCCPTSICARCIGDAEFVTVKKGKKGFCINCLKLAILAEENAEVDSKGRKVDFQDKQTYEYFFKEYLVMVNKTEGLTLEDLHTADSRLKRGEIIENESYSDADEFLEEELDSDIDGGLGEKCSVMKTPKQRSGTRKINYISWDPDEILGEGDNSKKRLKVYCDSEVPSELNHCMRIVSEQSKSTHAAIVEKNINSLYLRKSLVLKLLKDPETFESKVAGCFVRVKKDPKDFYYVPSIPYQLGQVKGTKKAPHIYTIGDMNIDVVLCITNMKDIQISMLSDDDIEEDECEDLRQMVKKGLFQRPTIAELDRKIKSMHRDIMNHWIGREVLRLQKMIERANDKGWRAELFDCIDRRELLHTSKEKTRLLEEIPNVIAEMEDEHAAVQETPLMDVKGGSKAIVDTPAPEVEDGPTTLESFVPEDGLAAALKSFLPDTEDTNQLNPPDTIAIDNDLLTSIQTEVNEAHLQTEVNEAHLMGNMGSRNDIQTEVNEAHLMGNMGSRNDIQTEVNEAHLMGNMGSRNDIVYVDDDTDDDDAGGMLSSVRENSPVRRAQLELEADEIPETLKVWHYIDHLGVVQGPFSKAALRYGHSGGVVGDYKVWRSDQFPGEAISLAEFLGKK